MSGDAAQHQASASVSHDLKRGPCFPVMHISVTQSLPRAMPPTDSLSVDFRLLLTGSVIPDAILPAAMIA